MSTELSSEPEELKRQFASLKRPEDVALMLEINYETLIYYLYILRKEALYKTFEVSKKSGGKRIIKTPILPLKLMQRKLNQVLQTVYEPKNSAHGFIRHKNVLTNVEVHMQRKTRPYVLNVDIQDFFPSINFGRVRGLFMASPYLCAPKVATVLAQICCVDNQLPQGAPTSPVIANMICSKLDTQLQHLALEHKCFYTRYADDITFSTSRTIFPRPLARPLSDDSGVHIIAGTALTEIVEANGFKLNPEKIRLQSADRRQEVTGIVINKLPNVPRAHINQIRALLHSWETYGVEKAATEHFRRWGKSRRKIDVSVDEFVSVVRGKIGYLGMVRGRQNRTYRKFMEKFVELNHSETHIPIAETAKKIITPKLSSTRNQIFISYSHKDNIWLERLETHLKPLEREHLVVSWSDKKILPGSQWRKELEAALNAAKVAVLLVSPDFLASDFIANHELPPLLKAEKVAGLTILWIAVRSSMFEQTEIGKYQAANDPARPLADLRTSARDKALVQICNKILGVVSK